MGVIYGCGLVGVVSNPYLVVLGPKVNKNWMPFFKVVLGNRIMKHNEALIKRVNGKTHANYPINTFILAILLIHLY